jgi:hypothetical protein
MINIIIMVFLVVTAICQLALIIKSSRPWGRCKWTPVYTFGQRFYLRECKPFPKEEDYPRDFKCPNCHKTIDIRMSF